MFFSTQFGAYYLEKKVRKRGGRKKSAWFNDQKLASIWIQDYASSSNKSVILMGHPGNRIHFNNRRYYSNLRSYMDAHLVPQGEKGSFAK